MNKQNKKGKENVVNLIVISWWQCIRGKKRIFFGAKHAVPAKKEKKTLTH